MAPVHFVTHRRADLPLCGNPETPEWIETSRPESVTCEGCASRLVGVRDEEHQQHASHASRREE